MRKTMQLKIPFFENNIIKYLPDVAFDYCYLQCSCTLVCFSIYCVDKYNQTQMFTFRFFFLLIFPFDGLHYIYYFFFKHPSAIGKESKVKYSAAS